MDAIGKGVEDPLSGVSGCIEAKCVRGGGVSSCALWLFMSAVVPLL